MRVILDESKKMEFTSYGDSEKFVVLKIDGLEIFVGGYNEESINILRKWREVMQQAINFLETPESAKDEVPPVEDESEYGDAREAEGEADEWYDQNFKSGDDGEA